MNSKTIALVGLGTASLSAATALRSCGFDGRIVAFSDTDLPPYSPVLTSYYAGGAREWADLFTATWEELAGQGVEVHASCPVTGISPDEHLLRTAEGDFAYDCCLIATGSTPAAPEKTGWPAVEAADADAGVAAFAPKVLRTPNDAHELRCALEDPACEDVLVSGTSFVALKALEAVLKQGKKATLLGRSEHILKRMAVPEVAALLEAQLAEAGVELRLGQTVQSVAADAVGTAGAAGCTVTFSNGDKKHFDQVVVAHGMVPNLAFIEGSGLACETGLLVDDCMRTSAADVYAAGDVAQLPDLANGGTAVAGLFGEAALQGACAARAMVASLLGEPLADGFRNDGFIPANILTVDSSLLISGGTMDPQGDYFVAVGQSGGITIACVVAVEGAETEGADAAGADADAADERLVGFNVFSASGHPGDDAYALGNDLLRQLKRSLLG